VLDRDELAARVLVAGMSGGCTGSAASIAGDAVALADALIAALVPVAPASGAPLAAPSPSPAATPAAWVPSVGDVVGIDGGKGYGETRVVTKIDGSAVSYVRLNTSCGVIYGHTTDVSNLTYLRRATSSERAAAGLPVDESASKPVDRVALAKAIYAAVAASNPTLNGKSWDEAKGVTKRDAFNAADAAIAFMAKGGAS